jgi:hypothetical protein
MVHLIGQMRRFPFFVLSDMLDSSPQAVVSTKKDHCALLFQTHAYAGSVRPLASTQTGFGATHARR